MIKRSLIIKLICGKYRSLLHTNKLGSLSPYLKECLSIIEKYKLAYKLAPNETKIEGELDQVVKSIKNCHVVLYSQCTPSVYTTLKINTRIYKKQFFKNKCKCKS